MQLLRKVLLGLSLGFIMLTCTSFSIEISFLAYSELLMIRICDFSPLTSQTMPRTRQYLLSVLCSPDCMVITWKIRKCQTLFCFEPFRFSHLFFCILEGRHRQGQEVEGFLMSPQLRGVPCSSLWTWGDTSGYSLLRESAQTHMTYWVANHPICRLSL